MADNTRYYWIKLRTDFFNQGTIDFLLSQKNGCQYVVLYQMLCLQTANTDGELISKMGEIIIPYDIDKIVRDTKYFDFDTVTMALGLFKQLGLIYESKDSGTLVITDYSHMIGSESANRKAQNQRRYRERQKQKKLLMLNEVPSISENVTNNVINSVTDTVTDTVTDSDNKEITQAATKAVTNRYTDNRYKRLDIRDKDNRDITTLNKTDTSSFFSNNIPEEVTKNVTETNGEAEKKKRSSQSSLDVLINNYTENSDLRQVLKDFIKFRKAIRATLTDKAMELNLSKLDKLASTDEEKIRVVEQSIEKSWKGFYKIKNNNPQEQDSKDVDVDKYNFVVNNF